MPGMKFYIDNLPGAPFDYHWEVKIREEEIRRVFHDPTNLNGERVEVKMERVPGHWELRMVHEDPKKTERKVITSLTDDALRDAAYEMVERFILRNRIKVLEEETVRLVRPDDA